MSIPIKAVVWLFTISLIAALAVIWVHLLVEAPGKLERIMCIPLAGMLLAASVGAIFTAKSITSGRTGA